MRKTEQQLITEIAEGRPLTDDHYDLISTKMGKGQTKSRAREIAESTEVRYAAQLETMNAAEQAIVRRAISNYTRSSSAINGSCREGNPSAAAREVDQMFGIYSRHNFDRIPRVTYRLLTYKDNAHVPYGATTGNRIQVGDLIQDTAFVSASEHRQFLIHGVKNPDAGTRYVKMSINGVGGINISGGSQYTNTNEAAITKMTHKKTWRVRTPAAGQAEILYNRDCIFRVDKIDRNNDEIRVVVTRLDPQPHADAVTVKNSFTGA